MQQRYATQRAATCCSTGLLAISTSDRSSCTNQSDGKPAASATLLSTFMAFWPPFTQCTMCNQRQRSASFLSSETTCTGVLG